MQQHKRFWFRNQRKKNVEISIRREVFYLRLNIEDVVFLENRSAEYYVCRGPLSPRNLFLWRGTSLSLFPRVIGSMNFFLSDTKVCTIDVLFIFIVYSSLCADFYPVSSIISEISPGYLSFNFGWIPLRRSVLSVSICGPQIPGRLLCLLNRAADADCFRWFPGCLRLPSITKLVVEFRT